MFDLFVVGLVEIQKLSDMGFFAGCWHLLVH
jgi:hypothetical protein